MFVSDELKDEKEIVFNPRTHSQLVKLVWEDYKN